MISFAKLGYQWFNRSVKNSNLSIKDKIISRYIQQDILKNTERNTDVNVLLNRVRLKQKNESKKKLYFSAAASAGLVLFGLIIF